MPAGRTGRFAQWWLDVPVRWKGLFVITLPAFALVPAMVVAGTAAQRQPDLRAHARLTAQVTEDSHELLDTLVAAETGVRGYAATGDGSYLVPYREATDALADQRRTLEARTEMDVSRLIAQLSSSAQATLDVLSILPLAVDQNGVGAPELPNQLAAARVAMEVLQADQATLEEVLDARLQAQRSAIDELEARMLWSLGIGLVAGIGLGVIGMLLVTTGVVRRLERLADNTRRFVDDDELLPFGESRDEIGCLALELGRAAQLLRVSRADLVSSRDEAVAATRAKDEFLSRMSHELRTPLTAIIGFGQLLQLEELDDDDRESVEHIVKAGQHLLSLINEILDVARIETGHLSLSLEPIDVHEVVEEAVVLVGPLGDGSSIAVRNDCDPDVAVVADRQRLKQVLLNLLSNAIKYNRPGGSVTVRARPAPAASTGGGGGTVRISVTDTGEGIPAADLERIFAPFERVTTRADIDGVGVGLALSQGLVEAMGGTLGVDSAVDEGSTFWVDLARAEAHGAGPADETGQVPAVAAGTSTATVLYIEDNLANLRLLERLFRGRSQVLEVAMQGRMGIQLARQLRPGMVLLDLHLPDIGGEEVLRSLKADPVTAAIPVVVLSADTTPKRVERLLAQGAAAYLSKPVDIAQLVRLLDELAVADPATG